MAPIMDDATSHDHEDGSARSNGQSGSPSAGSGTASPRPATVSGPIYSLRLKILIAASIAASIAALSFAYVRSSDGDGTSSASSAGADTPASSQGVQSFSPAESSQVLQQETIRVDLAPGWDGTLTINGQVVPEEDLTRSSPRQTVDRLEFVPGPEKAMSVLPSGRVCASVQVWRRDRGSEVAASDTIEWCFDVL